MKLPPCPTCGHSVCQCEFESWEDVCEERDDLRAKLTAAEEDSRRLDWLEHQQVVEAGYLVVEGAVCTGSPFEWIEEDGGTLRAAIDAARDEE